MALLKLGDAASKNEDQHDMNLSPSHLVDAFGLIGIAAIIFAETGLLIGFFLPGDSLLFTAGAAAAGALPQLTFRPNIWVLIVVVVAAAIAGDQTGYLLGRRSGPALFNGTDRRLVKAEHRDRTIAFFDRHGPKAIVLARFVPIVRTLCPMVAGVGDMRYRSFVRYNVAGAVMWGAGVTLLGYRFGNLAIVRDHLELVLLGMVAVSVLPAVIAVARQRFRPDDPLDARTRPQR
ncbi:MAG TPA: VTT domain-containing protein [Candidatus Microthrix sp.]|nr:VTT domain-containing protein [Candidatus Microthrix sp.]